MSEPPDLTMAEQAVGMHEAYISLRQAGFNEHEAMHVVLGKPCCADWCRTPLEG